MIRIVILVLIFIGMIAAKGQTSPGKLITKAAVDTFLGPSVTELMAKAETGDKVAQFQLGEAYFRHAKYDQGLIWYRKSAKQGYSDAQEALGSALLSSTTGGPDVTEALKWLRLAANQNHSQAQVVLGQLFTRGKLVPTDYIQAMKWLMLANKQQPAYRVYVDSLALKMTKEQIAEASRQAETFKVAAPTIFKPEPKLQGIMGKGEKRIALISGRTFAKGESGNVKVDGETVSITCLDIVDDYVVAKVNGEGILMRIR